jgi:pimeloyl-ACP methyl ester carboxylesterase
VISELPEHDRPAITLIGHSMGVIVVNQILRNFPDLPYRNIVFMGGAASVRDTLIALGQVTRDEPRPGPRFYNLSLHQLAEANEVSYFGAVSKGSLLEWVDRMYTTPATFADRTVGKWLNAVMAYGDFLPLEERLQMSFKRFGLSCAEPLKHGEFDEYERRPGCAEPRTPYWHPAFWVVSEAGP